MRPDPAAGALQLGNALNERCVNRGADHDESFPQSHARQDQQRTEARNGYGWRRIWCLDCGDRPTLSVAVRPRFPADVRVTRYRWSDKPPTAVNLASARRRRTTGRTRHRWGRRSWPERPTHPDGESGILRYRRAINGHPPVVTSPGPRGRPCGRRPTAGTWRSPDPSAAPGWCGPTPVNAVLPAACPRSAGPVR